MNNSKLNFPDFEKSVTDAKAAKKAYEEFFEKELLAQISKIINGLPYRELVKLNHAPIKITQQDQLKITKISIGYVSVYVQDFNDFFTDYRMLRIKPADVYTGFCTAYNNLFKRLLEGATIPGIIYKVSFFGKGQLLLDI